VIDQFLGITAATDPMTGTALPAPSTVTVSVLNGTGAYNQAATTAFALGGLGFHIVGTGDADPVGDPAETVVTYANAAAERPPSRWPTLCRDRSSWRWARRATAQR